MTIDDERVATPAKGRQVMRPGERHSLSRSATRALDVLELFGEARRPLRAIEMVTALGVHPSSMSQLLKTMVESAHLIFDAHSKSYRPSPRLMRFSAWMLSSYGTDRQFEDLLRRVHRELGAVVTLTTPNDLYMQILDVVGTHLIADVAERGLRVSLFGSATGMAYLATLPHAEIVRLAMRARVLPADIEAVLARIGECQKVGVAVGPSLGGVFWSIAVSLPRAVSPAPLVLGVTVSADRIKTERSALQLALRRIVELWLSAAEPAAL